MINEKKYLDTIRRYGFFNQNELNDCFLKLSREFFPLTKPYVGGFLDREISNEMSLFIGNMSRDAMIMIYDDSKFVCNEKTPNDISFAGKGLTELIRSLEKYNIRKDEDLRQGIYYFNHKTATETRISFKPEMEVVKSEGEIMTNERRVESYIIACENPFEKAIQILMR